MAFLALASQKSLLNLQKNFYNYSTTQLPIRFRQTESQMVAIKKQNKDVENYDEEDDPTYLYYEQLDEQLSSEKILSIHR